MSQNAWIAAEFSKGIAAEQQLATEARARAESPPDPTLGVLYHEIAAADDRHGTTVETIATRYGHTPSRGVASGLGGTISRLKDKVSAIGATPHALVAGDLAAKADAIHWTTAWVHCFETIGDDQSARELAAVLTEDVAHRDALQEALNRLIVRGVQESEGK